MENKNLPAFPAEVSFYNKKELRGPQTSHDSGWEIGLTKREYIAAKVLPATVELFSPNDPKAAAKLAVEYADALLTELEK